MSEMPTYHDGVPRLQLVLRAITSQPGKAFSLASGKAINYPDRIDATQQHTGGIEGGETGASTGCSP